MISSLLILVGFTPFLIETRRLGIINGENSDIAGFSYQLSMFVNDVFTCGATIISPSFALTAAHCIFEKEVESLSLRAGSSFLNKDGEIILASRIIKHPLFNIQTFDYDFAIIKFEKPLKFNRQINAVKLSNSFERLKGGTSCVVSGFGLTEDGDISEVLKSTKIKVIDDLSCKLKFATVFFPLTDRMMCAGEINPAKEGNRDACTGDSGGPLICDGKLHGVVSSGAACGSDFPGIFGKVSTVRDWIRIFTKV